jgi:hypothetical protein
MVSSDLTSSILYRQKIAQLNETMNVRFGTMILGQAMSVKTKIIQILQKSYNQLYDQFS